MSMVVDIHKKNGKRPHFDIYIGRLVSRTEFNWGSKWHNPFVPYTMGRRKCLEKYEEYIRKQIKENSEYFNLEELRGKRLGCWCINTSSIYPTKCHGQILMKLLREKR